MLNEFHGLRSNTVIAAGSVVNKSIPGNGVYGGVPAKYICSLDDLINKRLRETKMEVGKNGKYGLTDQTVEACWQRFRDKENRRNG